MTILMTSLSKAKNGDWFARKGIPADVRDAYQRAYGVRQEERFRRPAELTSGEAKAAFADWVAEVEGRIALLRCADAGQAQQLTSRQLHALIGRWYDWFVSRHQEHPVSVADWDHLYERYQDVLEAFGGMYEGEPGEEVETSPRHRSLIRAKVLELSRLPSFLAEEGIRLTLEAHDTLVDTLEPDLIAAMALLRRQAGGDYKPDTHRERFPAAAPKVPSDMKLTGWDAWQAFEAWVNERKPAPATVNRWRVVFMDLNKYLDGRDIALMTDDEAVAWKDTPRLRPPSSCASPWGLSSRCPMVGSALGT